VHLVSEKQNGNSLVERPVPAPASAKSRLLKPEVRISVFYVLLASLWIIGSDTLLNCAVEDNGGSGRAVFLQSFKGLNFVVTTGILLYLVLRQAYGGWRRSEELRIAAIRSGQERFRSLSSRIQTLREEERTRISREIHDELGQLLTGIKMRLRLIEDHIGDRDDRSLNPLIDDLVEASGMIDETIESVRRIASGLRPAALDHLGLATALGEEAEEFTRRTGIECDLTVAPIQDAIPPDVETAAFRIFQESLTNVARHAGTRKVKAECAERENRLILKVRDYGVGFDPGLISNPASLGLAGMLERAADVGGSLVFDSSPGHGTEVVLTIPLAEENGNSKRHAHEDSHC